MIMTSNNLIPLKKSNKQISYFGECRNISIKYWYWEENGLNDPKNWYVPVQIRVVAIAGPRLTPSRDLLKDITWLEMSNLPCFISI